VLRGVEERPIYSSRGRFPPNAHMEGDQVPWQLLLLEVHLDGRQARFGRPQGSADPTWQADKWALVSFLVCIMRGAPVCSARWALFVSG
jgi:hypothetical protein